MLAQERYQYILKSLEKDGTVHTSELVSDMAVSSETVRKDLDHLEHSGLLKRVHGGAVTVQQETSTELPEDYVTLEARNTQHMEEKSAIVAYAAGLVKEKQIVALDYGSTSLLMAKELAKRFRSLTVITNSIRNALALVKQPDFTVILVGGILNREELSLGNDFSSTLDGLHIDIFFSSASGVHPTVGLTDQRISEARVQNRMRQLAGKTIVIADSGKFGKASLVKICSLEEVDTVITDSGLDSDTEEAVRAAGVELIIVPFHSAAD